MTVDGSRDVNYVIPVKIPMSTPCPDCPVRHRPQEPRPNSPRGPGVDLVTG